jgi:hypothetical protein
MVRTYRRKKPARDTTNDIEAALDAIRSGQCNVLQASRNFMIPRSTLTLHLKGWSGKKCRNPPVKKSAGPPTAFSPAEEERMAMCVRVMGRWGFGISRLELLDVVQEYVLMNKMSTRFKDGKPGEDWYLGFMIRHKFSLKKPEKVETTRMKQTDPFVVEEFFKLLKEEMEEKGFQDKPYAIFNCDETSFCHDPSNTKAISPVGAPCRRQTAGTGRQNTTVLATIAADGSKLPPFIVYKGKKLWENWMSKDAYEGTTYAVADKGWMTEQVFLNWFKGQFLPKTKSIDGPKLLIYDGHISHVSIELVRVALDNHVSILKLPPHTTHFLQPCDVSAFKPLKTKWDALLVDWQRHHYGCTLNKADFSRLIGKAWPSLTEHNIKAGFLKTGIFPLNPAAVSEGEYNAAQMKRFKQHKKAQSDSAETTNMASQAPDMNNNNASSDEPVAGTSGTSVAGTSGTRVSDGNSGTSTPTDTPLTSPMKRAAKFEKLIIRKLKRHKQDNATRRRKVNSSAAVLTREEYISQQNKDVMAGSDKGEVRKSSERKGKQLVKKTARKLRLTPVKTPEPVSDESDVEPLSDVYVSDVDELRQKTTTQKKIATPTKKRTLTKVG